MHTLYNDVCVVESVCVVVCVLAVVNKNYFSVPGMQVWFV